MVKVEFFQFDNYVGFNDSGLLSPTDCQGSAMTDAYRQDYSEFLSRNMPNSQGDYWTGDCLNTLAEKTTGWGRKRRLKQNSSRFWKKSG